MSMLSVLFPFLRWFPLGRETLRADLVAGVTVALTLALVLIPQSMAYAQLAGLPTYYGLYAAFLPVIVGALWGSSSQLATGPVAVVSLLTACALAPLAATGSEPFIALAILLAFLVGLIQLGLGTFRLGALVNLISHPVILGFMNAAALIIGLSQLNKLLGVPMSRSDNFANDIWSVLQQIGDTHLPTLLMGAGALALMLWLKRHLPKAPGVLLAVALTTLVSWQIGFESKISTEVHAWQTQRHDGVAAIVTFFATLFFAPHLDLGILIGAALAIALFLMRRMKPRAVILGRMADGTLSDFKAHQLTPVSQHFITLRYDGSLDFLSASHFEDAILQAHADFPQVQVILVIGSGINNIDDSGEEKIRQMCLYLRDAGVTLTFCSLKQPVREAFDRAGLTAVLGEENVFKSRDLAFQTLEARLS